jgi:hypothetical protein
MIRDGNEEPAEAMNRVPHFWPKLPEVGIFDASRLMATRE